MLHGLDQQFAHLLRSRPLGSLSSWWVSVGSSPPKESSLPSASPGFGSNFTAPVDETRSAQFCEALVVRQGSSAGVFGSLEGSVDVRRAVTVVNVRGATRTA